MIFNPPYATPEQTLEALPDALRAVVERLGLLGQMMAGDLYNLRHIAGSGSYDVGLHDGAYLAMALTSIGAAAAREEITQAEHDTLHAYALETAKRSV
ncbi:hypothetical protein QYE73_22765 [Pseudomonas mosselii]|uniref:hypothetical protein n=1 Tax=Pseudomonas mosselii TaxID=78327 RepID=UPI00262FC986|nr:hypothetical protein [Pseudomonas mosselii]MDN4500114.1 hypothetical protein [Pseudomonas mosselii]